MGRGAVRSWNTAFEAAAGRRLRHTTISGGRWTVYPRCRSALGQSRGPYCRSRHSAHIGRNDFRRRDLARGVRTMGENCCDRLVGDYAFALWDTQDQRLVLLRDYLGMRPLHYHRGKDFFAFASMPKGLHALAEIPRAPDEDRIAEFIALLPEHGPQSFFKGVERVEAAHIVSMTLCGLHARRHWNWNRRTLASSGNGDYVQGLRYPLDQAVQSWLRGANGRVGAHLSAGFDSSSIAATAARLLAPAGGKVVAFTAVPRVGYDLPIGKGKIGDEGPLAAATAAAHPNMSKCSSEAGIVRRWRGWTDHFSFLSVRCSTFAITSGSARSTMRCAREGWRCS